MTVRRCTTCDIPIQDQIIICKRCEQECRRRLTDQAAHLTQLNVELRRETRKHELLKAAGLQWRIPFNDQASELIRRQDGLLGAWTATVAEMLDQQPPDPSVTARSTWLAGKVALLRRRTESARLLEAVRHLDKAVIRLIDLPVNRTTIPVGPCPNLWPTDTGTENCPGQIDAHFPLDAAEPCHMECTACKESWPSWQWNRVGLRILGRTAQLERQAQLAKAIGGAA